MRPEYWKGLAFKRKCVEGISGRQFNGYTNDHSRSKSKDKLVLAFLNRKVNSAVKSSLTKTADVQRWSVEQNLSADWDLRAEQVCQWIPKDSAVIDIGCGRMAVEKFACPSKYIPVDIVARDDRTIVVDLNKESIPIERIREANFATLLGVLEYLERPEEILTTLASNGIPAICTYQLADFTNQETRSQNGWFNSYKALDFALLLHQCGYRIIQSRKMDAQGLYLLEPRGTTNTLQLQGNDGSAPLSPSPSKPKLVLSGFFGRGNTGDEALLQAQYEHLSKDFEILISVEQHGAFDGFWNWYPYNQCRIIGQEDLSVFHDPNVVGLHVGGGDLPIGFNAAQVITARAAGKLIQSSGVDIGSSFDVAKEKSPDTFKTYMEWTRPWVRSQDGFEMAQKTSDNVLHGADWALGLKEDCSDDVARENCLLVLREFPKSRLTPEIRAGLCELVKAIQDRFGTPVLLPFCPEDERFINELESVWGLPCQTHWWNPSRIKQYISQAKMIVSVGRFHPLVFAACSKTPAVFCEWGLHQSGNPDNFTKTMKAKRICSEIGIGYFNTPSALSQALASSKTYFEPVGFDSLHFERFEAMKKAISSRFLEAAKTSLR
jgi:hypothetical protein